MFRAKRSVLRACLVAAALSAPALASPPPSGSWSSSAPLPLSRDFTSLTGVGGVLYWIGGYGAPFAPLERATNLAYDPGAGSWTYKRSMPTARYGAAVAAVGTTIYVAGGNATAGDLSVVEAYDTLSDTWTARASMPAAVRYAAAASTGGKVYAFGGATGGSCLNSAYAYDPVANSWATLAAMPTARCSPRAAAYNGKIYVMGGMTAASALYATVEVYDPVANSWSAAAPMLQPLGYFGVGVASGTIYAVSGTTNAATPTPAVEAYDPVANAWSYKTATMPSPRFGMGADALGGRLYVVGGGIDASNSYSYEVQAYDPATDSWSVPVTHAPGPRRDAAAVTVSTALFVLGGQNGAGPSDDVQVYDAVSGKWSYRAPLPGPRIAPVAAALGGLVYAAGGLTTSTAPAASVWSFDPAGSAWTARAALPTPGGCGAAATINGKLYVLVSCDGTAGGVRAMAVYDPALNSWTPKTAAPSVHRNPAFAAIGGKLFVAGGSDAAGSPSAVLDVYDPAADAWTTRSPMPTARIAPAGGVLGGSYLVVAGGVNGSGTKLGTVEVYDSAADSWSTAPSLPTPRSDAAGATMGARLFAVGGQAAAGDSDAAETFTLSLATQPSVASVAPSSAPTGASASLTAVGNGFDATAVLSLEKPGVLQSSWTTTGAMATARNMGQSVVLKDGRILVAGGFTGGVTTLTNVDIYDPASGVWVAAASMTASRYIGTVALLSDGRVLAAGGRQNLNNASPVDIATSEIYDPATNAWTPTGPMPQVIDGAQTFVRPDGKVLAVGGGFANGVHTAATALYDPAAGTWSAGPSMSTPRISAAGVTLKDGRYLIAGGVANGPTLASAEVYDPVANAWTTVASMGMQRYDLTLTRLPDGRVLAAGGSTASSGTVSAEIYDPVANAWTAVASMSAPHSTGQSAQIGGKVLVVGGSGLGAMTATSEVYDPVANAWSAGPTMSTARLFHGLTALGDGRILAYGGATSGYPTPAMASAEYLSAPWTAISATAVSVPDAQHVAGTLDLTGAPVGYWDVVVRESNGRVGRLGGGFVVTSNPGTITFSGAALGTSSITWSWSAVPGQSGFRVLTSTGFDRSGSISTTTVSWIESGLGPNAATTRRLFAFDALASSAVSPLATVYTRAFPPTGTAATAVFVSSASLSWSLNGNPAGTTASVERSTDAAAYAVVYASAVTAFTDGGLSACTTYYYRVRDLNGDGLPTAYDATATLRTSAAAPLPPGSLAAQSLTGGLVSLTWSASPSSFVTSYLLYASTGALSYAAPYAVLTATATAFTTPALSTSTTYRFGLRAYSACAAADDGNSNVVASATPLADASGVRAAIKVPQSGKKVSGNRVTVMAEIVSGDPRRVRDVRFQYRTAASTVAAWADIAAAEVQHPNPAPTAPYFVHWDVTGLANGSYELRAVAELTDATVDPAPPSVVIGVDAVDHDTDETVIGGSQKKDETVYGGAQRTVGLADAVSGAVVEVTLPTGCVSASTDTLTVQINPAGAPPPGRSQVALGQNLQITLVSGQTSLNGSARIVMHYADADDDGVVDGTTYKVDKIAIYSYNPGSGEWRKESASVLDRTAKTITATTPHFSLFGLFATAAADLSNILVYPVPWVPGDSDPNNGKPYNPSDPTSGVVFDNLTDNVRIQVYSASGGLVWETSSAASGGRLQWDGRGSSGRDAASGGYIAVITDRGSGAKVVRKIAIIR